MSEKKKEPQEAWWITYREFISAMINLKGLAEDIEKHMRSEEAFDKSFSYNPDENAYDMKILDREYSSYHFRCTAEFLRDMVDSIIPFIMKGDPFRVVMDYNTERRCEGFRFSITEYEPQDIQEECRRLPGFPILPGRRRRNGEHQSADSQQKSRRQAGGEGPEMFPGLKRNSQQNT